MSADILEKRASAVALYDEYKALLTPTQRTVFADYYLYDLSLSEIASARGISRSGVADALKKALAKLSESEAALGLLQKKAHLQELTARCQQDPSPKNLSELEAFVKNGL